MFTITLLLFVKKCDYHIPTLKVKCLRIKETKKLVLDLLSGLLDFKAHGSFYLPCSPPLD